jgi:putative PIN family toxin of toxin-antitoxin system
MRIVLDTNVLTRAARGGGGPAEAALLLAIAEPHQLVTSLYLLDELSRAIRYDRVRRMHGLDDEGIDAFVERVASASIIVPIPPTGTDAVVPSDPDDDPIVATARLGKADVLCTLDRDLRNPLVVTYCWRFGIRVLTDVELLALLRG